MKKLIENHREYHITDEDAKFLQHRMPEVFNYSKPSKRTTATHFVCHECLEIVEINKRKTDCPHF